MRIPSYKWIQYELNCKWEYLFIPSKNKNKTHAKIKKKRKDQNQQHPQTSKQWKNSFNICNASPCILAFAEERENTVSVLDLSQRHGGGSLLFPLTTITCTHVDTHYGGESLLGLLWSLDPATTSWLNVRVPFDLLIACLGVLRHIGKIPAL